MKYRGSKNRVSKYIVPIIQSIIDNNNVKLYYEPFVGGANVIDKINCEYRVGNDIHKELIALLKKLQSGWNPPDFITETEYNNVREHKDEYPDYYVGLVGFCTTFGGKYFGGYARGCTNKGVPRNYYSEAIRNLQKQLPLIQNVKLTSKHYIDIDMTNLHNAMVYCDIPYKNTTKYSTGKFDYEEFYNWCREMSKTNILCVIL